MKSTPTCSPRAREQAEELSRLAGQMGATRVPDEALALLGDIGDTGLHAVLDALEEGQLERAQR